jgi:hypothetical protein
MRLVGAFCGPKCVRLAWWRRNLVGLFVRLELGSSGIGSEYGLSGWLVRQWAILPSSPAMWYS